LGAGGWTGKFSDEDEAWNDHKGLKDKLKYTFKNDGNWWMLFSDFVTHFNKVYLCKIFPAANNDKGNVNLFLIFKKLIDYLTLFFYFNIFKYTNISFSNLIENN